MSTDNETSAAARSIVELSPDAPKRLSNRSTMVAQQGGLIFVVVVLAAAFQAKSSIFLESGNVVELFRSGALYFVVACPATLVIVGGGLDFSVGAVYAAGGVFGGEFMVHGVPWPIAIVLGSLAGGLLGCVNALAITRLKVPALIATLGMFYAVTGVITVITTGNDVFPLPSGFQKIGEGALLGIPYLVYIAVAVGIIFHIVLEKTRYGYEVRATGGGRDAASANGVRVARIDLKLYAVCGFVTAFAGILYAARTGAASPQSGGADLTFEVVTAIIIGGTSLFGGTGTVFGSALGCILFAEMQNGLAIANINPLYQDIFVGVILISAVAFDQSRRRRRFRMGKE